MRSLVLLLLLSGLLLSAERAAADDLSGRVKQIQDYLNQQKEQQAGDQGQDSPCLGGSGNLSLLGVEYETGAVKGFGRLSPTNPARVRMDASSKAYGEQRQLEAAARSEKAGLERQLEELDDSIQSLARNIDSLQERRRQALADGSTVAESLGAELEEANRQLAQNEAERTRVAAELEPKRTAWAEANQKAEELGRAYEGDFQVAEQQGNACP